MGILKVPKQSISNWKRRGTVPYEVLFKYCDSRGLVLNWLINGTGPQFITSVAESQPVYLINRNKELEEECLRLRKVVKKIEDNISEINRGAVSDADFAPDTP